MATWNFTVTHKDQTTTTGSKTFAAPGIGQAVTIPAVPCMCGYNHTLVGTQSGANFMSGSGGNSVAPANDPNSQGSPKDDDIPSWEGGPVTPDEDELGDGDEAVDEEESEDEESDEEDVDESAYQENPDEKR